MAFDFSKLNFFNKLDARARVFVLFGVVLGIIVIIYAGTRYMLGSSRAVGPSKVATAPSGLQSVPGGQVTSEYYKAVLQANQQKQQQAQMSGTSAIATMINPGSSASTGSPNCNIICSDKSANVKDLLDDWMRQGKITPEVAQALQDAANKNIPVGEYAAMLDSLVKQGKLTPEQARELLEQYKKQHANALLQESANVMDGLIKSGALPLDAANELLTAQKNGMSPEDYAALLQRMVKEGRISPETAAKLLAQYTQQKAKEAAQANLATMADMLRRGEITPDVAKQLADLANRDVPVSTYEQALNALVAQGKLTPAAAAKLLDAYKKQKLGMGANAAMQKLIKDAEDAAYAELTQLVKDNQITPDTATQIGSMIQNNVSLDDFKTAINTMVQNKQLTPEISLLKIDDYTKVKMLRDQAARLASLQANNAPPSAYADELRKAVAAGILTPDQAAQMLQDYQAMTAPVPVTTGGGNAAFANLQNRVGQPSQVGVQTTTFTADQLRAQQDAAQARQERITNMMTAMQSQSGQLISAWAPPTMQHRAGSYNDRPGGLPGAGVQTGTAGTSTTSTTTTTTSTTAPLIKAGTIIFGVLDTTVNSDYPDSPVLVTIVEGQFKGAKLLGKLMATKGVAGQMDRIALNFTMMNEDQWLTSKSVTAYAIDPDTARTVMASSVDYHYLMRYGAIMATSFVQGYASAITQAGTSTTGIFGTSTTHSALDPRQRLLVGIGQIGTNLGQVTQNYVNIPPTVRVNAGVSLGILFMADVTAT